MTNLVLTALLSWLGGNVQHEQKKSRAWSRNDTTDICHSKKLCFWRNLKEMLNQLNSASWVEKKSREKSFEVQGFLFI